MRKESAMTPKFLEVEDVPKEGLVEWNGDQGFVSRQVICQCSSDMQRTRSWGGWIYKSEFRREDPDGNGNVGVPGHEMRSWRS